MSKLPTIPSTFDWGQPTSTSTRYDSDFRDTGWVGFVHLDKVLSEAITMGASDVHLTTGLSTSFTIDGDLLRQEGHIPTDYEMQDTIKSILTNVQYGDYLKEKDLVFPYIIRQGPYRGTRWRAIASGVFGGESLTFRLINDHIPTLSELKVEDEIVKWGDFPDGLFLVCGATGTGKSTTLASIINQIQMEKEKKIITLEDPIEYHYPHSNGKGIVVQREIGKDVRSYEYGLVAAMRQAPDVIVLGEIRKGKELEQLIRAGESGHLGVSTLHTNSVATTINRIIGMFDGVDRVRVLNTLSDILRGVCNQVLVKKVGGGRFACREILTINDEVAEMIERGDVRGIRTYQRNHRSTMEWKLAKAHLDGLCTLSDAREKSSYPLEFDSALATLKKESDGKPPKPTSTQKPTSEDVEDSLLTTLRGAKGRLPTPDLSPLNLSL